MCEAMCHRVSHLITLRNRQSRDCGKRSRTEDGPHEHEKGERQLRKAVQSGELPLNEYIQYKTLALLEKGTANQSMSAELTEQDRRVVGSKLVRGVQGYHSQRGGGATSEDAVADMHDCMNIVLAAIQLLQGVHLTLLRRLNQLLVVRHLRARGAAGGPRRLSWLG